MNTSIEKFKWSLGFCMCMAWLHKNSHEYISLLINPERCFVDRCFAVLTIAVTFLSGLIQNFDRLWLILHGVLYMFHRTNSLLMVHWSNLEECKRILVGVVIYCFQVLSYCAKQLHTWIPLMLFSFFFFFSLSIFPFLLSCIFFSQFPFCSHFIRRGIKKEKKGSSIVARLKCIFN